MTEVKYMKDIVKTEKTSVELQLPQIYNLYIKKKGQVLLCPMQTQVIIFEIYNTDKSLLLFFFQTLGKK